MSAVPRPGDPVITPALVAEHGLTNEEFERLVAMLDRTPTFTELGVVSALWSEHCSYKHSRPVLKTLPTKGAHVLQGPGENAGVIAVGEGLAVAFKIESHNHPSAVEPYQGAATGVGGILRDVFTMGARPIALLNSLRFGELDHPRTRWLVAGVVKGIGDYGNCMGVPTVAGEVVFDDAYAGNPLVNAMCVGVMREEELIRAVASGVGNPIIAVGARTGRDGIHGASFASKALEAENRSAVQIPDPFLEKLLLEATMEAVKQGCIKGIKDLGGGGLSCCLSETSDTLGRGFDVELTKVRAREGGMTPNELMISESQERMLYVTDKAKLPALQSILEKYEIAHSVLGEVQEHRELVVRHGGKVVAEAPSHLVAHAPLADRAFRRPAYLDKLKATKQPKAPANLGKVLLSLLSNPTIASKRWVYQQYDHEVGVRTVVKPGTGDAAVMRLDNGKFVAIKLDGNSKHCYLDPYQGTLGLLSEGCRNVICAGAEPIGVVDHLQFASPEDPEVYWTFTQAINAIVDYCKFMDVPVVGGKVSFYNETNGLNIYPTPILGMVGLIEQADKAMTQWFKQAGDAIILLGATREDLGGTEYLRMAHHREQGEPPALGRPSRQLAAGRFQGYGAQRRQPKHVAPV